jgi:hypothetical protein
VSLVETQHPLRRMTAIPEVVVKLRCYLLSLLRIHRPDCEHCKALEKCGLDMRERLEELNWRTQPYSLHRELQGDVSRLAPKAPSASETQEPTQTPPGSQIPAEGAS